MSRCIQTTGRPVRSLQTFLRKISRAYPDIPAVIPDGRYGAQTEAAVKAFQKKFGLPQTGETDRDTWNWIFRVYTDVSRYMDEPRGVMPFPDAQYAIFPGEQSVHLYVIQAMLLALSEQFANLVPVRVTGIHDGRTMEAVETLQTVFGMEENGMIEKEFWERLARLYESAVSKDRFHHHRKSAANRRQGKGR